MSGRRLGLAVAVTMLTACTTASAAVHHVGAEGNFLTGGLRFDPPSVAGKVGDIVRWQNTDFLVPHTATEDHGLWDLTGSYGGTPLNPPGFGPGEVRERPFEAGTFSYFCEVHPQPMKGEVAISPTVWRRGSRAKPRLHVAWSVAPPPAGQVFDVQRRVRGRWTTVRDGTRKPAATFRSRHGTFRARLRLASEPGSASGYSPAASR